MCDVLDALAIDGHGGPFEDGECTVVDRARAWLSNAQAVANQRSVQRIAELEAENARLRIAVVKAYGLLWSDREAPSKEASEARRILREGLTLEERRAGVKAALETKMKEKP